ncbi:hypothetical protein CHRY9390_01883 [Chryseobacterium aquaeductus]|uniref:Uncharacterized protein n=1 Tax=Chryseobacterium aquaeductus TaxID=2675056 RepID=A0A9N8QQR1_9FLAO|nr:hypothetical protein CHRY9390_01883 [Chryseobacterium potabilaquae]CAD7808754.1 hypothetical protein CHRY9390_01883 [Chryseobacterium aquaeductus]
MKDKIKNKSTRIKNNLGIELNQIINPIFNKIFIQQFF